MGSSVSLPTGRTSFSVISANASAALRWRSTLSENESVVNAARGESLKKSVVVRSAAFRRSEYGVHMPGRRPGLTGATHFPDTARGPLQPPARSPTTTARMLTSASGLFDTC